ncbi:hypothetical protein [Mucilaginibacter sp. SP1R1]|uniref:hypothetical protein n=1 Tax=Mucilaginibacter sp. SP1R1 TaxID=2723091 RepID=UPI0016117FA3|nr:hypothetical protein [Mucilaginibacter sp. SP1R1]MBB6151469.1 hypothetical protein [Mucilaginibacter sp. SP1R1]
MKNKISFWTIIGFILLFGVVGYLGYILISTFIKSIQLVSPNIIAAIIAGLVTVTGYFISRNFERKKIIEQQIREKKLPVYEEFINFLFNVMMSSKTDTPVSDKEMEKFLIDFNKKSIIWLSDNSLNAFIKWRSAAVNAANSSDKTIQNLFIMEELLLEFRKDIGHSNKGLKRGDLLTMFVNDMEQYL